jgi:hypothetical protein
MRVSSVNTYLRATYNDISYTTYARATFTCLDYYAIAPSCPTSSEIDSLQNCFFADCGAYCVANGPLPDGNYHSVTDNCMVAGKNFSVFIHLCSETNNTRYVLIINSTHRQDFKHETINDFCFLTVRIRIF